MKREKGSIAIFVLVALLFMSAFLIISFASNVNKSKTVKEQFNIISGIYAYANGEEGAYEKAYSDLRNKNKQTMTASSENSSTLELTKTFNENMSNYRIYGNTRVSKLPEEYQEVEYIESTGTQWIDTLITPEFGDIITTRAERIGKDAPIFYAGTNNQFAVAASEYGYQRGVIYTKYFQSTTDAISFPTKYFDIDGSFHNINFSPDGLYIDEIKVCGISNDRMDANTSIRLFRITTLFGKVRIANFSVVRNNTILINLIPCYRKVDNAIGMYDLVNNVFYTNAGTGTFNQGNAVIENVGDIVTDITDSNYGKYKIPILKSLLPEEYQEVEYIESTGTQWIDTLITPEFGDIITTRAERIGKNAPIFYAGTNNQFAVTASEYGYQRGVIYTKYFQSTTDAISFPTKYFNIDGSFHNINFSLDGLYIDEIKVCGISNDRMNANTSIRLFRNNTLFGKVRIANFSVVRNNTILINLIPCYRKVDNVIGMYDLVNNVFYTNAGTGTFNKCSDEIGEGEITNIYLDEPLRKIRDSADYIDFKTGKVVRYVGKIDSYNGEEITTAWTSNTGTLSTGSTVYYVLETPTEESITLPQLKSYEDYTKIEVLTSITPSKIEVEYMGYTLE